MARQRGVIKLQGTIDGITFVNSKRYKPHTRAERGTHKKAGVNEALQRNADNASKVTSFGSLVLRQLKALEKGFAACDLWSQMTACMFRAKSTKVEDLLHYAYRTSEPYKRVTQQKINSNNAAGYKIPVIHYLITGNQTDISVCPLLPHA